MGNQNCTEILKQVKIFNKDGTYSHLVFVILVLCQTPGIVLNLRVNVVLPLPQLGSKSCIAGIAWPRFDIAKLSLAPA